MLASIFGFDKYTEITSEQAIRGTFCDLAIKLDGKIKFLIEVKAIGLALKETHLRQAVGYGANNGIPWVVLTNGLDWQIYKIRFEKPISYDSVCSIGFAEISSRSQEDLERVFLLCKEGIEKAAIEGYHDHVQNVNRFVVGAIVQSDPVVTIIRRELKKIGEGVTVTTEEIQAILSAEVLKRDIIQGELAEEAAARVRKAQKKQVRKKAMRTAGGAASHAESESESEE